MKKMFTVFVALLVVNFFSIKLEIDISAVNALKPISEWSIVQPLKTVELDAYNKTWNISETLTKNQQNLVDMFLDTCCVKSENIEYFGGEYETFVGERIKYVVGVLEELAKSPIGCELMRILTAKCCKGSEKIYFVKSLKRDNKFSFEEYGDRNIIIIPDKLEPRYYHSVRYESDILKYLEIEVPKDCIFLHEMLHWLHSIESEFSSGRNIVILQRFSEIAKIVKSPISSMKTEDIQTIFLNYILNNDEDYRTMFGVALDEVGCNFILDPLNEAAYTYAKYGWIRASHAFELDIERIDIKNNENKDIISILLSNFGDKELWNHYLKGKVSIPMFGKSQYRCSDLNP